MKLSIITVNLNNRDGLQKTIDSVVSQTFKDFEWIVIDGGSTDGSKELIEQYADHFAYWVSEPDKGIYNAMNKGVRAAQGEYLQFLNSGDYLRETNTLDKVFSNFPSGDIIYGNLTLQEEGEEKENRQYPEKLSFYELYLRSLPHPSTFIKTSLLKNDPYDERLRIAADWKFFLKMALESRDFRHIPMFVSCFDQSGISSTNMNLLRSERDLITAEIVPPSILNDIFMMSEINNQRSDVQIKKLITLRGKSKFYHKAVTSFINCMNTIDAIMCHGKKNDEY